MKEIIQQKKYKLLLWYNLYRSFVASYLETFKFFTDHSTLKYLVNKPVLEGRIYIWLLPFQEFNFEVVIKLGRLNVGPDHL